MLDKQSLLDASFEPLVAAAKGNARALLLLAQQAKSRNLDDRAIDLAWQAKAAANGDPEFVSWAGDIIASTVPTWHWPMLQDHPRNTAFENAIKRAVTAETRVLDIGSGSGLLAMFAARAGAKSVVSCEANPAIAQVAKEIVRRNGFEDRVTVLARHSTDLDVDADLGGPVDLVVLEIFGKQVVDEFVLPAMQDAAKRLIKPDAQIIPRSADVRVALAWWGGLEALMAESTCGFDVSPFHSLRHSRLSLDRDIKNLGIRGEAESLFSFDLSHTQSPELGAEMEILAHGGPINGVVQWIGLQMDDAEYFENRPDPKVKSSWAVQFFPLSKPINPERGARVKIAGSHRSNALRIWEA